MPVLVIPVAMVLERKGNHMKEHGPWAGRPVAPISAPYYQLPGDDGSSLVP